MISRGNPSLRAVLVIFAVPLLVGTCATAYSQTGRYTVHDATLTHRGSTGTSNSRPNLRSGPVSQPAKVTATLEASPTKYTGQSPAHVRFRGTITATAACVVKYTFVRSDGSSTGERTISFTGAGTKSIGDSWSVLQNMSGWEAIRVTSPASAQSSKASFEVQSASRTLTSHKPLTIGGREAHSSSSTSAGENTSSSGSHNIRTLGNGSGHRLTVTPVDGGSSNVTHPRIINSAGLHRSSNNLPGHNVHGPTDTGIRATLHNSLSRYFGSQCPITIHFNGSITASARCTVKYVFDRSDGATMQPQTLTFDHAGTQRVKDEWTISQNTTGWEQLRITSPSPVLSDKSNILVQFRQKKNETSATPSGHVSTRMPLGQHQLRK